VEAGILGGKIYLGAYAQHLGATGLTFYDDEVIKFFLRTRRVRAPFFWSLLVTAPTQTRQGLKPVVSERSGTAEAVPFQNYAI